VEGSGEGDGGGVAATTAAAAAQTDARCGGAPCGGAGAAGGRGEDTCAWTHRCESARDCCRRLGKGREETGRGKFGYSRREAAWQKKAHGGEQLTAQGREQRAGASRALKRAESL